MNKDKLIKSMVFNIIIILFVLVACIVMFSGIRFMHGPEVMLECSNIEMFKFFTVDSNIFMAIVAGVFLIYELLLLKGKIKKIPKKIYILKYMGTCAVTLTFSVVFLYLGWIAEDGILSLLMNSNLFLHLLVPLFSIFTFTFFEKTDIISFKDTVYGLIPMFIYGVFYLGNVFVHTHNGQVSPVYDFYYFLYKGIWMTFIFIPIIIFVDYLGCYLIWKFNKKGL